MIRLLTGTFFLFFSIVSFGQWSDDLQADLINELNAYISSNSVTGVAVHVHGDVVDWHAELGISEEGIILDPSFLLGMGSVSKPITAASVIKAMDEAELPLTSAIDAFLPNYPNVDSTITVLQLLNHTSGIYNYTQNTAFFNYIITNDTEEISPEFVLNNYVGAPNFSAGSQWSYSNTNYALLGLILEELTGQEYHTACRNLLSLSENYPSIQLAPQEYDPNDLAHLWDDFDGTGHGDVQANGLSLVSLFSSAGAAGAWVSTTADLSRFIHDLFTGDILTESQLNTMLTVHPPAPEVGQGVLFGLTTCGLPLQGHSGAIGYQTSAYYQPNVDLAIVVMSNDTESGGSIDLLMNDLLCMIAEELLSVEEEGDFEEVLTLYPNPSKGDFTIELGSEISDWVEVSIYDLSGRQIFERKQFVDNGKIEISSALPSGMYQVRCTGQKSEGLIRLVVE